MANSYSLRRRRRASVDESGDEEEVDHSTKPLSVPSEEKAQGDEECAVCLQTCIHPARLPCGHVFCFLCIKGFTYGGKRCAMCRRPIPQGYLDNPELLNEVAEVPDETYQWFYEGRNGWWQYDRRTNTDLEEAYGVGETSCELLIAGFLYTVDFNDMIQYRTWDPNKRRKIKRDLSSCPKKGIAGLRTQSQAQLVEELAKINLNAD